MGETAVLLPFDTPTANRLAKLSGRHGNNALHVATTPPPPTLQQVATSSHEHVSATELGGRLRPRLTSTYVSEGRVEYGAGCYTSLTARPDEGGGEGLVYPGPGLWLGLGQWIIFL